jgi:hypothetical protein
MVIINTNDSQVGFIKETQRSEDFTVVNIYIVMFWSIRLSSPPNGHFCAINHTSTLEDGGNISHRSVG